jgi:hypothetical protein
VPAFQSMKSSLDRRVGWVVLAIASSWLLAGCVTNASDSSSIATSSTASDLSSNTTSSPSTTISQDASYEERLGRFAQWVLRGGDYPLGSFEHLSFLQGCLAEGGFEASIDADEGAIETSLGQQEEQFRTALAECAEEAFASGVVGRPTTPGEEELAAYFEAYHLTYECLLAEGYQPEPPPSVDLFVESGGTNWHPYNGLSNSQITAIEDTCPQDLIVLFEQLNAAGQ